MKYLVLATSLATLLLATAAMAQDDQQPPVEHRNKHGLIEPTSKGSSGEPSGTPPGANESVDEGTIGGSGDSENYAGSSGVSGGSLPPNPYPNATDNTGMIVGGSVTGTGALTSAHPSH